MGWRNLNGVQTVYIYRDECLWRKEKENVRVVCVKDGEREREKEGERERVDSG